MFYFDILNSILKVGRNPGIRLTSNSILEKFVYKNFTTSKERLRPQKRPSEQPSDSTADKSFSRKEATADDVFIPILKPYGQRGKR